MMQRAQWDDEVSVLSAENVLFEIETAGLAARFAAVLLDMLLQLFALLFVALGVTWFVTAVSPFENWSKAMFYWGAALGTFFVFLIAYAYYFFFEWLWNGQTPGKRLFHLRVIQSDGMPITYWHALIRNTIRIADFLPAMYGVGALLALLDVHNRRAGDLLAGTIVAHERSKTSAYKPLDIRTAAENFLQTQAPTEQEFAVSETPSMFEAQPEPRPDVLATTLLFQLNAQDYELAHDFLVRSPELPETIRLRLAESLAVRLATKLEQTPPPSAEAEKYLQEITQQLHGRF